ncbi:hypothetical protein [Zobellia sp. OII3]|uniref:hypothetical protein n=1 Tax=Zobellia sp. OII3 TaxID=2034520 RepID=UPI0013747FF6|nr:hypothetical protein [Zobellia sp. OII3]
MKRSIKDLKDKTIDNDSNFSTYRPIVGIYNEDLTTVKHKLIKLNTDRYIFKNRRYHDHQTLLSHNQNATRSASGLILDYT